MIIRAIAPCMMQNKKNTIYMTPEVSFTGLWPFRKKASPALSGSELKSTPDPNAPIVKETVFKSFPGYISNRSHLLCQGGSLGAGTSIVNDQGTASVTAMGGNLEIGSHSRLNIIGSVGDAVFGEDVIVTNNNGKGLIDVQGDFSAGRDLRTNFLTIGGSGKIGSNSFITNHHGTGKLYVTGTPESGKAGGLNVIGSPRNTRIGERYIVTSLDAGSNLTANNIICYGKAKFGSGLTVRNSDGTGKILIKSIFNNEHQTKDIPLLSVANGLTADNLSSDGYTVLGPDAEITNEKGTGLLKVYDDLDAGNGFFANNAEIRGDANFQNNARISEHNPVQNSFSSPTTRGKGVLRVYGNLEARNKFRADNVECFHSATFSEDTIIRRIVGRCKAVQDYVLKGGLGFNADEILWGGSVELGEKAKSTGRIEAGRDYYRAHFSALDGLDANEIVCHKGCKVELGSVERLEKLVMLAEASSRMQSTTLTLNSMKIPTLNIELGNIGCLKVITEHSVEELFDKINLFDISTSTKTVIPRADFGKWIKVAKRIR